jgi:hypothetical protein
MAQAAVRAELQILVAAVAAAMLIPAVAADPELSFFDMEFRMDFQHFHLMQMVVLAVTQQCLCHQELLELFLVAQIFCVVVLSLMVGTLPQMVQEIHML